MSQRKRFNRFVLLGSSFLMLSGCYAVSREAPSMVHGHETASSPGHGEPSEVWSPGAAGGTAVLDLGASTDLAHLLPRLADRQLVFVGETHERYDHHLNQLAVIEGLYRRHPDLVIGLEYFQRPFQPYLDQFIAGAIDEKTLLKKTEYFDRWRYDYRLYRPILSFARENDIPLIALNVPAEITKKVSREGLASLTAKEQAQIPKEIDRSDRIYEQRLRQVYEHHPAMRRPEFDHFLEAQLLWDESMAERIAAYFKAYPQGHMVVLVGSGHLIYGSGIPKRVQRRVPVPMATLINGTGSGVQPEIADYLLLPEKQVLPRSGLLGVLLDTSGEGVQVKDFSDKSPARAAGLEKGDRILRIAGDAITSYPDIRLALLDEHPGDKVRVVVMRRRLLGADEQLSYEVTLY